MTRSTPTLSARIVEEASDWFIEFSEGTVDASAREQFDAWLRRSPEHVQAYLKIAALWEEAPVLGKCRVLPSDDLVARVLAEGNVVSLDSRGSDASTAHAPTPRSSPESEDQPLISPAGIQTILLEPRKEGRDRPRLRILAVAASLLVLAVTGAFFYYQRGTYSTATGEERSVSLEDGSTLDLNSQSKVRVRFSAHERSVELLQGQALFRVTKDTTRPFIVSTDTTQVRAVGTQFDVYRKGSGTVVTVIEGRVAVLSEAAPPEPSAVGASSEPQSVPSKPASTSIRASGNRAPAGSALPPSEPLLAGLVQKEGEVLLAAGQQLTVSPKSISQPRAADVTLVTAWTQRKIAFQGATLRDAVAEFNRYNTRRLVVADPTLMNTRISGVFSSSDPGPLLRFLRELPNVTVAETDSEIRIFRK
jgi:transmembrane sensor